MLQNLFRKRSLTSSSHTTSGGVPTDLDECTIETVELVRSFTMTSPERIAALCNSVEYIVQNQVPGAIVECGVWRGGSMMAVAHTLKRLGDTSRDLYLFDTFDGMPAPSNIDRRFDGLSAETLLQESDPATSDIWAKSQLSQVQEAMASVSYDGQGEIHFVQGKVEDTLPDSAPTKIAILRLDTDWYESTLHEMTQLFPRLVQGGVLIIDDYGYWQGARRAIDEYIRQNNITILLNRIDETGRIAVKLTT